MVLPSTLKMRYEQDTEVGCASNFREVESLAWWVRGLLLGVVLGLAAVFSVALWLNPYEPNGSPRRMATHQQLGLPPCSFNQVTRVPCPACGMTTSFSLLIRADVVGSLRANWVGTLLASFCLLVIPWALIGAVRGKILFIRSLEKAFISVLVSLLVLMFLRWGLVLAVGWYTGTLPAARLPSVEVEQSSCQLVRELGRQGCLPYGGEAR